jgi:aryl-alcohol dehydrogenase-like predicted oxidoreductase
MRYRALGSSDVMVSEISLGSWLAYGASPTREQAEACVNAAFDVGITLLDTANVYGLGAGEKFLGDVLRGRPRDSYVLATKLYHPMSDTDRGLSRAQVFKQIDASLARLRTDYVDLYQCHRYDWETPLEETLEALTEIVRVGKVRAIGFSEWPAERIQAALDVPGVERFVSSQPQYSMLWRDPEPDVIPLCAANGISQLAFSPLGQGVLTGKYHPGASPPDGSRMTSDRRNLVLDGFRSDDVLARAQRLQPIAGELGLSSAQLALAWVLREPNVASAIIGASRPEHVAGNAAAAGVDLDAATLAAIEAVVAPVVHHTADP